MDDSQKLMSASAMQPRPASPVAKALEEQLQQHQQQQEENDDRPRAPVAKALLSQTPSSFAAAASEVKPPGGVSAIPNLLSSGEFPPPPHSPRHGSGNRTYSPRMSMSPPTIVSSPVFNSVLASPPSVPAAPPSTPYTPHGVPIVANAASGSSIPVPALHPPLVLASIAASPHSYSLNRRPSTPPLQPISTTTSTPPFVTVSSPTYTNKQPLNIPPISPRTFPTAPLDPHCNALLNQALHEATRREKSRTDSLTQHESQNYTTVEEYKHALSRERRHSTTLAVELAHYKFLTRYASCNVHAAAEINEEARINHLIKNIDNMKRDMNEDRCRVAMELEREEERIVNGLMTRLEEVEREKMLLERQIGSVRGTTAGSTGFGIAGGAGCVAGVAAMDGEERRLYARFEQIMADSEAAATAGPPQTQERVTFSMPGRQQDSAVTRQAEATTPRMESSLVNDCENDNKMEEGSEEEEEDENENDEILEGRYHDPEMEEELANLLQMKQSKS